MLAKSHLHTQVSKEVAQLRNYEASLLRHYQAYLKGLLRHGLCVSQGTGPVAHARVAVRCMCQLLTTAPHFNYTCVVAYVCAVEFFACMTVGMRSEAFAYLGLARPLHIHRI